MNFSSLRATEKQGLFPALLEASTGYYAVVPEKINEVPRPFFSDEN